MNAPLRGPQDTRFYPVVNVAQTGSTNNDVVVEAQQGATEGFTLVADYQTQGRGRFDRSWFASRNDSLLLSTLLQPELELVSVIPLLVGLAVQESVQRMAQKIDPAVVGLKWPNDVIILDRQNAKIAGILAESTIIGQSASVVVGIGLNIKFSIAPPDEVAEKAVCLAELGLPDSVTRQEVLSTVLVSLERWLTLAETASLDTVVAAYEARCATVGQDITFIDSNGAKVSGRALGIENSGGLIVETSSGPRTVFSNDIYHLGLIT